MLVIGATGRIGRRVVDELLMAGVLVRALTRRPAEADLPAPVEIVGGDLTVPGSVIPALQGVASVFLVWTAPPSTIEEIVGLFGTHAPHVTFLSSPHQTPHPFFEQPNPMAAMHATIERCLAVSGCTSTIIRPGMFASNVMHWWAAPIREGRAIRWPYGAAETAPIDERDIAAVAARALIDGRHAGGDHVLTGPTSLSQAAQARIIGEAIGRPILFEEITPEEFRHDTAGIWPPMVVEMLLAAWNATMGHTAYVTTAVSDILGRPARTFHQWAFDHAQFFA